MSYGPVCVVYLVLGEGAYAHVVTLMDGDGERSCVISSSDGEIYGVYVYVLYRDGNSDIFCMGNSNRDSHSKLPNMDSTPLHWLCTHRDRARNMRLLRMTPA